MRKWAAISSLFLGLMLGQAAPVAAATTLEVVPVEIFILNPCNGDQVFVSGNVHILIITNNAQGNYHVDFQFNSSGLSGVDQDGTKYIYVVRESAPITAQVGAAFEQTIVDSSDLISQGAKPNFAVVNVFHWTFDANGNITAFHSTTTTSCS